MDWLSKISKWYTDGFWSEKMVQNAVAKNKISQEECDEILKGGI